MQMKSVFDTLRQEHALLNTQMQNLVTMLKTRQLDVLNDDRLQCHKLIRACRKTFLVHRGHEEVALFPDVEQLIADPKLHLDIMHHFFASEGEDDICAHITIQQKLQELDHILGAPIHTGEQERICAVAQETANQITRHTATEERIIFMVAERLLTPAQLATLNHRCQDTWTALASFL